MTVFHVEVTKYGLDYLSLVLVGGILEPYASR